VRALFTFKRVSPPLPFEISGKKLAWCFYNTDPGFFFCFLFPLPISPPFSQPTHPPFEICFSCDPPQAPPASDVPACPLFSLYFAGTFMLFVSNNSPFHLASLTPFPFFPTIPPFSFCAAPITLRPPRLFLCPYCLGSPPHPPRFFPCPTILLSFVCFGPLFCV